MLDQTLTQVPEPAAPILTEDAPVKTKRAYNYLPRRFSVQLARAETLLQVVASDPALQETLAAYGYDAAKMAEGAALWQAAQASYNERLLERKTMLTARVERSRQYESALRAYVDFRTVARAHLTDETDRSALGLDMEVPRSWQIVLTHARAAYNAALNAPAILATLTQYGMSAETIRSNLTQLDDLSRASAVVMDANANAKSALEARDEAGDALAAWVTSFRHTARIATRENPSWQNKLEL